MCLAASLRGQQDIYAPSVGYVFPGGASRGQTVELWIGGQQLNSIQDAIITGEGVSLTFLKRYPKFRQFGNEQRRVMNWRIASRESELAGKSLPKKIATDYAKLTEKELERGNRLLHPMFENVETMDAGELLHLRHFIKTQRKYQFSFPPALSEVAVFELQVEPGAELGEREIRIVTKRGLSNPLRFQVSDVLELREVERRDKTEELTADAFELTEPVVWNGQVLAGDIDRFCLQMEEGESLVFEVLARRLIPYIADAVPGWFQPTLSVHNESGEQLAFVDDHVGSPDPILEFTAPRTGEYTIEIRDSIYRGRFDFVYRLFASHHRIAENSMRHADVSYDTPEMPYVKEREPNGSMDRSTRIFASACVAGTIHEPGDVDMLCFEGRAGEKMIAEIEARRLGAPTDSLLRLLNEDGEMIAFNDDYMPKQGHVHTGPGLQTHYADSYLTAEFPKDGYYFLVVEDAQGGGGVDHKYRLRLSKPEPAYEVRVSPSGVNFGITGYVPLHVWVNRKDGFDGAIQLALAGQNSEDYRIDGGLIPAGKNEAWITLRGPNRKKPEHVEVELVAQATVDGELLTKPVVATDNAMQAFLWRHLVPAQELRVSNHWKWQRLRAPKGALSTPLSMSNEQDTVLLLDVLHQSTNSLQTTYECKLEQGPDGWSVEDTSIVDGKLQLTFVCDEDSEPVTAEGNLIVSLTITPPVTEKNKKPKAQWQGVLPAIPYVIEI